MTVNQILDSIDRQIIIELSNHTTYRDIAKKIFRSFHTVKWRVRQLKDRFDCETLHDLLNATRPLLSENIESSKN